MKYNSEAKMELKFMKWLFDDEKAWSKTINDFRYRYDMPLEEFMQLYQMYKNNDTNTN